MKKIALLLIFVVIAGCRKASDSPPATSGPTQSIAPLPISPICTTSLYSADGGVSGLASLAVPIPNYDTAKGDTADFSYKRWDATAWSAFHQGLFSNVTFAMSGSTVTITNTTNIQYDWALAATIHECH